MTDAGKAVFLDYATLGPDGPDPAPVREVLPDLEIIEATAPDEAASRIAGARFVLTNKVRLDEKVLATAPELAYIGLTATGTDNVDLAAARRRKIAVTNIRAYCSASVVEHVFGMLLGLTHNIGAYHRAVRGGKWQASSEFCLLDYPIRELTDMTLGVVGYGELGRAVAERGRQFGMSIIVAARRGQPAASGRVPFEKMLRLADVVSLHCPLNEETRNMIDREALSLMKRDAILINTARGGLVDTRALADALSGGRIGAAGIDVLPQEPPVDGDPLIDYDGDNLLLTPHIAWATRRARENAIRELAENLRVFLEGGERNRVA